MEDELLSKSKVSQMADLLILAFALLQAFDAPLKCSYARVNHLSLILG